MHFVPFMTRDACSRAKDFRFKVSTITTGAGITKIGGRQVQNAKSAARAGQSAAEGWWPKGWWSIVDFKIGIVPLPVFVVLLAVIAAFAATGTVPSDILMAIVLLSMGGFTCAELGKRIPIIRNIGAAAIFATFIPSFLGLPSSVARLDPGLGDAVHQGFELSLSVHFLHHRRQHPGDGPRRSHQGVL